MAELLPTLTSIAAVLCFVFALVSRRRLLETKALLADAALRVENSQKQGRTFEQHAKALKEDSDRLRQQNQTLDKALEESKQRLSERTVEWSRLKLEKEDLAQRALLQREHLDEQVQVLTQQLSEAVREKKLALEEAQRMAREGDEKTLKQLEALRAQLKEGQQALTAARREKQHAEAQLEKAKEQFGSVRPEELKRYKLKVLRLEQLYTSMRGLREMAEERNRNWETALRSFATHILQVHSGAGASASHDPAKLAIGPLVGAALEKIGARLVDESTADEEAASGYADDAIPAGSSDDLLPTQL